MTTRRALGLAALAIAANRIVEAEAGTTKGSSAKAERILVSFATNRNKTDDDLMFGSDFRSEDRSLCYTGTVEVGYDAARDQYVPDRATLQIDALSASGSDTLQSSSPTASSLRRSPSAIERFAADDSGPRARRGSLDASKLFFVHGYKNTFAEAIASTAKMAREYGIAKTACFSWPSYGSLFRYKDDQEHARVSGPALSAVVEQLLPALDKLAGPGRMIDLVCHSMGAQVLSSAVATLQEEKLKALLSRRYFKHTILAAPNESSDALGDSHKLQPCIRLSNAVFVYTNVKDKILNFSGEIINHRQELGQFGPDSFDSLPENVFWVDCTKVADNDIFQTGHGYFLNENKVVNDIKGVLRDNNANPRKRILA